MLQIVDIENYQECDGCGERKELTISIQGCFNDFDLCEDCFNLLEGKINLK